MTRRNKSNLVPPKPPEPVILGAAERAQMLAMVHMWKIFELYLTTLIEWGECQRLWEAYQADQSYANLTRWLKHKAWAGII